MSKYQPYPAYKDSGIEWLGEVPEHWVTSSLKFFIKLKMGYAFSSGSMTDSGTPLLRIGDIHPDGSVTDKFEKFVDNNLSDVHKAAEVVSGDIVMAMTGATIGKVGVYTSRTPALLNQRVCMFDNFKTLNKRFLWFFLNSDSYKKYVNLTGFGGAQPNISDAQLGNASFAKPKLSEQKAIANFLDRETAKIDALIEKQQKLIELLKEKRQAVISHAVTKGLNPNAPMKDSGVEWLGEIPAHWVVIKCGYLGRLFGSEAINEELISDEGDLPYIKVSSLSLDSFELARIKYLVHRKDIPITKAKSKYVVFPKRGAAIFTNKVNIVNNKSFIDPNLMGWSLNERSKPEYVALMLKLRGLSDIADVSTVPQINNKHIEPMKFPLPPMKEQIDIIHYTQNKTQKIDTLTDKAQQAIDLLKERKTALISAAVTGKIDVRDSK